MFVVDPAHNHLGLRESTAEHRDSCKEIVGPVPLLKSLCPRYLAFNRVSFIHVTDSLYIGPNPTSLPTLAGTRPTKTPNSGWMGRTFGAGGQILYP